MEPGGSRATTSGRVRRRSASAAALLQVRGEAELAGRVAEKGQRLRKLGAVLHIVEHKMHDKLPALGPKDAVGPALLQHLRQLRLCSLGDVLLQEAVLGLPQCANRLDRRIVVLKERLRRGPSPKPLEPPAHARKAVQDRFPRCYLPGPRL